MIRTNNKNKAVQLLDFETMLRGVDPKYQIEIRERSRTLVPDENKRYFARFNYGEVKAPGCLITKSGDGKTPHEALADYAKEISGELLWFGTSEDCFKIRVPELKYTRKS